MDREQARQEALRRVKRKKMGRLGQPSRKLPNSQMSMGDKFRLEQRRRLMNKKRDNLPGGMLTGGQAKLDKNKNGKIDAQDFKILKAEKAKGRGKGLQDEKMKPGKVMKANKGLAAGIGGLPGKQKKGLTLEKARKAKEELLMDRFRKFREKQRNKPKTPLGGKMKKPKPGSQEYAIIQLQPQRPSQILPKKKMGGVMKYDKGGMGEAKGYKKYLQGLKKAEGEQFRSKFKAKEIAKAGGRAALKAAKASRIGKIAAGVAAVGLGAKEFLKRKMEKRKRIKREKDAVRGLKEDAAVNVLKDQVKGLKKKMGGGMMMRRPMGNYMGGGLTEATQRLKAQGKMGGGMMMRPNPVGMKSGKSVKVKCKLGRNKPTKMY
jgi:hypothetical protein